MNIAVKSRGTVVPIPRITEMYRDEPGVFNCLLRLKPTRRIRVTFGGPFTKGDADLLVDLRHGNFVKYISGCLEVLNEIYMWEGLPGDFRKGVSVILEVADGAGEKGSRNSARDKFARLSRRVIKLEVF